MLIYLFISIIIICIIIGYFHAVCVCMMQAGFPESADGSAKLAIFPCVHVRMQAHTYTHTHTQTRTLTHIFVIVSLYDFHTSNYQTLTLSISVNPLNQTLT